MQTSAKKQMLHMPFTTLINKKDRRDAKAVCASYAMQKNRNTELIATKIGIHWIQF